MSTTNNPYFPSTSFAAARTLRAGLTIAMPVDIDGPTGVRTLRMPVLVTAVQASGDLIRVAGEITGPTAPDNPEVDGSIPPDAEVTVLTAHYGICAHCGQVSPCPDEWMERRAADEVDRLAAELELAMVAQPHRPAA